MPKLITESIKRLTFYAGRTIGTEEGERIWEAIDLYSEYLHSSLSQDPILLTPPTISNISDPELDLGEWYGFSLNNPIYQLGTQTIPFNEANAGATTGPTSVSVGRERWIVIMARHSTLSVGSAVDVNGFPVDLETHHAVSTRVIMSTDFVAGTNPGAPADFQTEIDAGSVPLVAILRGNSTLTVYPLYTQRLILDDYTGHQEAQSLVPPGTFIDNRADSTALLPTLNVVNDGGLYYVELDNTNEWLANLDGLLVDNKLQGIDANTFRTDTNVTADSMLRLQISNVWPERPRLYLSPLTNYPASDGDDFDPTPSNLAGIETTNGSYPSTTRDIALGLVTNGAPPTVVPLASPPKNMTFEFAISGDYSVGLGANAAALEEILTLPIAVSRDVVVTYKWEKFEPSVSAPANRDVPHQMFFRCKYNDFTKVVTESRGSWIDVAAAFSIPLSNRYFRPPSSVSVTIQPPTSKV